MLTSHVYWNLDGFQNPSTNQVLNHSLELPYSDQRIAVDDTLIPTGEILPNKPGSVNDFWTKPKQIGASFNNPAIKNNCGAGCNGYDNCWLINRTLPGTNSSTLPATGTAWWEAKPVAKLHSEWSGIQANIYTDQDALYMNSCNFQDGESLDTFFFSQS
jgi:aldose 1-epimerase